jgi:hypothetical protein
MEKEKKSTKMGLYIKDTGCLTKNTALVIFIKVIKFISKNGIMEY